MHRFLFQFDVGDGWYHVNMNQIANRPTTSTQVIEDISKLILIGTVAYLAIKNSKGENQKG